MKKMAITILTTSFPTSANPSSGIFIARLARHLSSFASISVVTPAARASAPIKMEENINVYTFKYAPEYFLLLAHQSGGIPVALKNRKWLYFILPLFFISMAYCLYFKSRSSDLIHAHWSINGCIAGIVGLILNKPVVTTLHGDDVTRAKSKLLDRMILWFSLVMSTKVISVNDSFRNWIIDNYPRFKSKVMTIPNGIDNSFLDISHKRIYSPSNAGIKIITIGSLIPRKGIDVIIRAIGLLKNQQPVSLTIAGEGHAKKLLQTLVDENDLTEMVHFVGDVNPSEIPELLANHDIFVLASHSEGRPSVILEAMATGIPIIASNISGTNELIRDNETGKLFPDNDFHALAQCIEQIGPDYELKKKLGTNATDFIVSNKLLWSDTARRHAELYEMLVSGS